ncbi:MAG: (2Fe-2S)-binding protein [Spirochaetaceae bacterium]|jgi:NADH-quinone oxidoreductase subunit G|nr:(2Fe-2S)-binding protein [Spirochaetaceae bacterium]
MENRKYMTVDGRAVEIAGEKNVLEVISKAGIELPVFCNDMEFPVYGHCRLCMVETGDGALVAACSTEPREGMTIKTNTEELKGHRRTILKLMLENPVPDRLRELAEWMGVVETTSV